MAVASVFQIKLPLHSIYSRKPIPGAPFAAMSYATKWRGGPFDWPSHGRGKESKVVQNMRYPSALVLMHRCIVVSLPEGVGAEDGEVLGVA
tara:strand:- start:200 stop:472 length:273 start_codon:yes stop_codon:yes gene_type:complete